MPRSARAAARVICVSHATASRRGGPLGRARARSGSSATGSTSASRPATSRRPARRSAGASGSTARTCCTSARSSRARGWTRCSGGRRGSAWRLVLAGRPGFDGERLLAAARGVGAAVLEGVGDDQLVTLYRAAEAVAAPALYEGFGIVPLEAMACGTPVAAAAPAGRARGGRRRRGRARARAHGRGVGRGGRRGARPARGARRARPAPRRRLPLAGGRRRHARGVPGGDRRVSRRTVSACLIVRDEEARLAGRAASRWRSATR